MSAAEATIMSVSGFPMAFIVWRVFTNKAFLEFVSRNIEVLIDVFISMSDRRTRNMAKLRRASRRADRD